MEQYEKAGHEKLMEMVQLHQDTIIHLNQLLRNKQEKERKFWSSLLKDLEEVS